MESRASLFQILCLVSHQPFNKRGILLYSHNIDLGVQNTRLNIIMILSLSLSPGVTEVNFRHPNNAPDILEWPAGAAFEQRDKEEIFDILDSNLEKKELKHW